MMAKLKALPYTKLNVGDHIYYACEFDMGLNLKEFTIEMIDHNYFVGIYKYQSELDRPAHKYLGYVVWILDIVNGIWRIDPVEAILNIAKCRGWGV
jgi:hypothetical protein